MLMQNFGVTNKEHYGMLWYFLVWSIAKLLRGYDEDDGEEDGKKRQVEGHFKLSNV